MCPPINETLRHTLDILQGSVASHLRCGGIFSDSDEFSPDYDSAIILKIG